ncbi:ALA-interacting subunit 5-like [Mangifera indica]|uniref:ALA-interacting subunit 5-like n=1 Tax=Mangifera indica TaxID=29780 RepID=UPI001CFA9675|nr:ALA-interacting subunit 5-like [Mangifera indica]
MKGATSTDSSSSSSVAKSKKPVYSRFSQQELPANRLILTPASIITAFIAVGLIFIPLGLVSLFASDSVVEIIHRYDVDCLPSEYQNKMVEFIQSSSTKKTCTKSLTVPKQMKSPVFIYYQLENFYQNHRRFVKSRSDKQLHYGDKNAISTCAPVAQSTDKSPIVPCGLVAWSLFNDTYGFSVKGKSLQVNKKDIAWGSDKNYKFGHNVFPENFQKTDQVGGAKLDSSKPLSEQEDLIVWMRTATLPTFRKLYGRIEQDLQANDMVTVVIENNYNTYGFKGTKSLVLSTTSWIGGKNNFIGLAYITVGAICLLLAIFFILLYVIKPR